MILTFDLSGPFAMPGIRRQSEITFRENHPGF